METEKTKEELLRGIRGDTAKNENMKEQLQDCEEVLYMRSGQMARLQKKLG